MNRITIRNRTRAAVVARRVEVADSFVTRLVGLLGRSRLDTGCGLLIQPSSGVHTFGMRFPIDVVALDREFRILKIWHNLPPWRTSSVSWKTRAILEFAGGHLREFPLEIGDQLEIVPEEIQTVWQPSPKKIYDPGTRI